MIENKRTKPLIGAFFLYYLPNLGGAEISQHNYFVELSKYYNIHVTCFMQGGRYFTQAENFVKDGIFVTRSPKSIDYTVREFIRINKPDIIATQLIGSDLVINEAVKNDIPVVFFSHGIFEDVCFHHIRNTCQYYDVLACPHGPLCPNADDIQRHLIKYKNCYKIICNSEYTIDVFNKIFPEVAHKLCLAYPNFNYDIFQYYDKPTNDKIKVLAVNSSPFKGRDLILDIALKNKDMEFRYVDCRKEDIEVLSRSPNIQFFPKVSRNEMADFYKWADVTVIPTVLHETFSGVACESILSGTPVISTIKGNLPNIVKNGVSGALILDLNTSEWTDKIKECSKKRVDRDFSEFIRNKYESKKGFDVIKETFDSIMKEKSSVLDYKEYFDDKENFVGLESNNKKIMFFAKFFYPPLGGGEYFILSVLKHLATKGFQCEAVCYTHPDPGSVFNNEVVYWDGIKVHRFPTMNPQMIVSFLQKHKPDLVITQSYDAPVIVDIAKQLGIKTIFGTHFWRNICEVQDNFVGMLERPLESVRIRKDLHRVFRNADKVYVNSEYMRRAVNKYVDMNIDRIICPIMDKKRVVSKERNPEYVVLINPDVGKGGRLFLSLSETLPYPKIKLMNVGFGNDLLPENKEINKEIRESLKIKSLEKTDDISKVYAMAKIILLPSLVDETFSMVALEAMANGIPVLASNLGNLKFLVTKGGKTLDPFDLFHWKEEIERLCFDDEYYSIMSKEAKERSQDFPPEEQLSKFYNMVVECFGENK
jgi:glycosyltransferase involved in cell wall biosynthesis